MVRLAFVFVFVFALGCSCARARAQEPEPELTPRDIVVLSNVRWKFSFAPGIYIPVERPKRVGFTVGADVRYGFDLGAVVLAPGLRFSAFLPRDPIVLSGYGTLRLTLPLGPVGPFLLGGVGPGWFSEPSHVGVAYLGGGGIVIHIGTRFAIGGEATYQAITGTRFSILSFGPVIMFRW